MAWSLAAPLLGAAAGCTHWFFSGVDYPDRSRPVARVETRGGVEYAATTTDGILFLGRTAQAGPCRVHYFLGETPMVEDGEIRHLGGVFYAAEIDLKHQSVDLFPREPTAADELIALVHGDASVAEVPVSLAAGGPAEGDVLEWPGTRLPAGTGVFARDHEDGSLRLVGLVSGAASLEGDGPPRHYVTFAGTDRLRELLAVPRPHPAVETIEHRPDDISVIKRK